MSDLMLSELSALSLVTATANWIMHCESAPFAVAAANHSRLNILSNYLLVCVRVCLSVCPAHCGKMADQIWMRFVMLDRMGPDCWVWDWSMGGGNFGVPHCKQWGVCTIAVNFDEMRSYEIRDTTASSLSS